MTAQGPGMQFASSYMIDSATPPLPLQYCKGPNKQHKQHTNKKLVTKYTYYNLNLNMHAHFNKISDVVPVIVLDWHPSAMTHFPSMNIDFLWTISDPVMDSFYPSCTCTCQRCSYDGNRSLQNSCIQEGVCTLKFSKWLEETRNLPIMHCTNMNKSSLV